MRRRIVTALVGVVLTACTGSGVPPSQFDAADSAAVRAAFDSLFAAIGRLDATATLAAYDSSSAFAHVFDGALVRGRTPYDAMIRGMFPTLRAIEHAAIDSAYIIPVGKDAAMHVSAFHETVVDTSGHRVIERGMWSNLFLRRPNGWKVIYGHTTHVVQPSK
jgi:ketosteroid isomerase-like protein